MKKFAFTFSLIAFTATVNAQQIDQSFFTKADKVFNTYIQNGAVDYPGIRSDATFKQLIQTISTAPFSNLDATTQQAYLINAYNLLVINEVIVQNIEQSVLRNRSFFEAKTNLVAGKKISLNTLEKQYLLKTFGDARFHFVLVCGAKGCPPIVNFAYTPERLERQLEQQTRNAINDNSFIRVNTGSNNVQLSQIFNWYAADFGGNKKAVLAFINRYRNQAIPSNFSVSYYEYDWSLNGKSPTLGNIDTPQGNNSSRYVVSAAIPQGTTETKIFNNLYTQQTHFSQEGERSNFFTTSLSFLYGVSGRFNAGFDLRYRRVSNTDTNTSPLNVFTNNLSSRRHGIRSIGSKIRWPQVFKPSITFMTKRGFIFS